MIALRKYKQTPVDVFWDGKPSCLLLWLAKTLSITHVKLEYFQPHFVNIARIVNDEAKKVLDLATII